MILGDRIRKRIKTIGTSQAALAREINVTPQAVSKMVVGGTTDSAKLWQIARFLRTTPEYLTGESDDPTETGLSDRLMPFRGAEPQRDPDEVEIDHVDLHYGMGGSFMDGHREVAKRKFSRAWLRQITDVPPEQLAWMQGDGNSMEPTIRSGEPVLVDLTNKTPGMDDNIWAAVVGDIGIIKRLRVLPSGTIEIHSDNPLVPVATAVDGELHVIGRVVAVVRKL